MTVVTSGGAYASGAAGTIPPAPAATRVRAGAMAVGAAAVLLEVAGCSATVAGTARPAGAGAPPRRRLRSQSAVGIPGRRRGNFSYIARRARSSGVTGVGRTGSGAVHPPRVQLRPRINVISVTKCG